MKRNKQQKYRIKIIQELHLNKTKQKELDDCVKKGILTYDVIYLYKDFPTLLKIHYVMSKYSCAMHNIGTQLLLTNPYTRMINNIGKLNKELINILGGI